MAEFQKKSLAREGSGVRGIIPLRVLTRIKSLLREQSGNPNLVLAGYFDYIGSARTGRTLAATSVTGISTAELNGLYRQQAPQPFALRRNRLKHLPNSCYGRVPTGTEPKTVFDVYIKMRSDELKPPFMQVILLLN